MAENAPALYILQKKVKRGRTLILERNIKSPFAPRGQVYLCLYKGTAQPDFMGRALLNFTSTLFHGFSRLARRWRENFEVFCFGERPFLIRGKALLKKSGPFFGPQNYNTVEGHNLARS